MIVVHHLENSRSLRVLWALEELGLEYQIKSYPRNPRTRLAPPELRAVHPLGKSPVITDGPLMLAESGAILEYLVETYGNGALRPAPGTPERQQYRYFMHYAEGSLMPLMLLRLVIGRMGEKPVPIVVRSFGRILGNAIHASFVRPNLQRHMDFLESELTQRAWFAGALFTAADIQISYPLEVAGQRAGLDAGRPRLMDFLRRIHERPAYARAIARGGALAPIS
ncbi:MAG: glutathione S-transferase [Steroidobacteraceae bacterium]